MSVSSERHRRLGEDVAEAGLAIGDELDAGLGARDVGGLLAEFALQHGIDMRFVLVDEARRTAERGDFRRDGFFGVRAGGRRLDGADAAAFERFGETAELRGREVLRVDAPAALLVQHLRPVCRTRW